MSRWAHAHPEAMAEIASLPLAEQVPAQREFLSCVLCGRTIDVALEPGEVLFAADHDVLCDSCDETEDAS